MSDTTAISWCDRTWSPWEGCTKISPGCDNCYAAARNGRFSRGANWGPGAPRRKTKDWSKPYAWDREAQRSGKRISVFPSICDPFDNEVDPEWRAEFFALIAGTSHLDWLLLTKRVGNAAAMTNEAVAAVRGVFPKVPAWPWPNAWLGATVVNQEEVDRDVPKLLAAPARVRFLSIEPMLWHVDLSPWLQIDRCQSRGGGTGSATLRCGLPAGHDDDHSALIATGAPWFNLGGELHWVIAGGESGPKARPAHPDWFRSLRDHCAAAGVPFHFKQWGEWLPAETDRPGDGECYAVADDGSDRELTGRLTLTTVDRQELLRVGTKAAGRLLDGVEHNGFPA